MPLPGTPTIKVGETELVFECNYARLLELEEGGDWQDKLQSAMGHSSIVNMISIAALFTGKTEEEITALSPPMREVSGAIVVAWDVCMRGPIALQEHMTNTAAEVADDVEGKSQNRSVETSPQPSQMPSGAASASEISGA